MRRSRFYQPNVIYEATANVLGDVCALRPCAESKRRILGVIARALFLFSAVRLHAFNPLSTHLTALLSSSKPEQLSPFLCHIKTNISKELKNLHGRERFPNGIFEKRRARMIPIHPDPASIESRFRYCLAQGTKEGLVKSPRDWTGASGVPALEGKPLYGVWYDRTALGRARARAPKRTISQEEFATVYPVTLTPLPHWQKRKRPAWRSFVKGVIDAIEVKAETERGSKEPLGMAKVMAMAPDAAPPNPLVRTPAPRFHAVGATARKRMKRVLKDYDESYRAATRLPGGVAQNIDAYPPYCYPPHHPMTGGDGREPLLVFDQA